MIIRIRYVTILVLSFALRLNGIDIFYKPAEPLGPSSRNTGLVFSEIMYNYGWRPDGRIIEFIELYNSNPYPEDLSGYKITGLIDYTFPSNTVIQGKGFLVIARSAADMQAVYGLTNVLSYGGVKYITNVVSGVTNITQEPITISGTGTLELRDKQGAVLLSVRFSNNPPWPAAADGAGHSLVLARPSYGENDYRAWTISDYRSGSPGRHDSFGQDTISPIVINEVCSNPTTGERYIEIYNRTPLSVDLSDYGLTDDPTKIKYKIPRTVHIPPYGRYSFPASMLGFSPAPMGETIYLFNPAQNRVLDAFRYEPHPQGKPWGRYPDGAEGIYLLSAETSGTTNAPPYRPEVVINEIMYAPISGDADDEYIELYNRGTNNVDLGGWELGGGINFGFPTNTLIKPGEYLVVARNMTNLYYKYNNPSILCCGKLIGNYNGNLRDSGEKIELRAPFTVVTVNQSGRYVTNNVTVAVDTVDYKNGGSWGKWSYNGGSSLELIDPRSNSRLGDNWADSDETAKAGWEFISGSLEFENGYGPIEEFQIFLEGKGECLIDNVEVAALPFNVNLIGNSTFESGVTGWRFEGNHSRSRIDDNGYLGTKCLHLVADGAGDNYANRVITKFTAPVSPMAFGVSIRARVRWLAGSTNIVLRIKGNYAEFRYGLTIPVRLGTPGEQNSRYNANKGPAIYDVNHSPVTPAGQQNVLVTAKVDDPDGISNVKLYYALDGTTTYNSVDMKDDGTGGDLFARDGIYSSTIPAQLSGALVKFYIEAYDNSPRLLKSRYPAIENNYECLIRFGETQYSNSTFGTYRVWITQSNLKIWSNEPALSKLQMPVTFVYNNSRPIYGAVIGYGADLSYTNYNSPIGNLCNYIINYPADDRFLGSTELLRLRSPGSIPGSDTTLQRSIIANWMAKQVGIPYSNVRLVRCLINGNLRGTLMEDYQEPNLDFIQSKFRTTPGYLFSLQPYVESYDGVLTNYGQVTLNRLVNIYEEQSVMVYRYYFSAINPDSYFGAYQSLFNLVNLLSVYNTVNYDVFLNNLIDTSEWIKYFVFQRSIGNTENYGYPTGNNGFLWFEKNGKWTIIPSAMVSILGNSGSSGPIGDDLYLININDTGLLNFFIPSKHQRLIWHYIKEVYDSAFNTNKINLIIDSLYSEFQKEGINADSPINIKNWINNRRNYINSYIQTNTVSNFTINLPPRVETNTFYITITGEAPLSAASIQVNSNSVPIKWLSTREWQIGYSLQPGTNILVIQGFDANGIQLPSASNQIVVITPSSGFTGNTNITFYWSKDISNRFPGVSFNYPVVINEIMYNSKGQGGDYLEIYNPNSNLVVDLSGWRIDGIGYTFPKNSVLRPGEIFVIVEDIRTFINTYGTNLPVVGKYDGTLNNFSEKIALVIPGDNPSKDYVVDVVRYDYLPPWYTNANSTGYSLQLKDPFSDNSRAANWIVIDPNLPEFAGLPGATPGLPTPSIFRSSDIPDLWINEVQKENYTGIINSYGERSPWIELFYTGNSPIVLSNYYLSDTLNQLDRWKIPDGTELTKGQFLLIYVDGRDRSTGELHSNFTLSPTNGFIALSRISNGFIEVIDYVKYTNVIADMSFGSYPDGQCVDRQVLFNPTPGTSNISPVRVFINEWMAINSNAFEDDVDGDTEDWFELYNMSYNAIDISGYYLTDNLTNRNQFRIPEGTIIPPRGYLIVWADGEPRQNKPGSGEIHVNFTLSGSGEAIGLFAPDLTLIDSVVFGQQIANVSQGRYPDGSSNIFSMTIITPGKANVNQPTVLSVPPQVSAPGGVVYFTMTVVDALPGSIYYAPGDNCPPNVMLNPNTGVFVWLVPTNQPVGSINFNINTYYIRPGALPVITPITVYIVPNIEIIPTTTVRRDILSLKWQTLSGIKYQIQSNEKIDSGEWKNLGNPITAISTNISINIPITTNKQMYFRVITVP